MFWLCVVILNKRCPLCLHYGIFEHCTYLRKVNNILTHNLEKPNHRPAPFMLTAVSEINLINQHWGKDLFISNFSFPESQADVLFIEVQDDKKTVQGQTTIPVSSLTDNLVQIFPASFNFRSLKRYGFHRPYVAWYDLLTMQGDRIRWWPIYHDNQECVGKIQLFIGSTITNNETSYPKVWCPSISSVPSIIK